MEMQNSIWKASTNWNITEGSLHESISYDTSADAENLSEAEPLLLTTPDVHGGSPPCEITIYFKEKHEIHRVYVRSTARVFEIYLSYNQQDNSEYLCTVKCGAVIKEVPETSNGTASIPEKLVRNASSLSDEDGWVKVKDLNSQEHSTLKKCDGEINCPQNQVHYEATAEISNVEPCLSLTVRLLSVQTKDCVHINEIYVYADAVESHETDPSANTLHNSGSSAMFAALLPSLIQLSKSSTNQNTRASEETSVRKVYSEERTAQAKNTTNEKSMIQEVFASSTPVKNSSPVQEQTEIKYYVDQNTGHVYTRIEKVLNELIVKVDRVESFCSSFEEKLLKPLDSMDNRIQQLEQKLDSLVKENKSSNKCICSTGVSIKSSECDPKNKGDPTFEDIELKVYANDAARSMVKSESRPGLIIKAPEFIVEEDDSSDNEDALNSFIEESHKEVAIEETMQKGKGVRIHSASASSLTALLRSANHKSNASHESVNDTNTGPLDNITCHNSASEDIIYDHTEELITNTTTETMQKKKSVSIDSAVASPLAALLRSAKRKSNTSHESVNDTNISPLDNITCHTSASEDGIYDHTEELITNTTTETMQKKKSVSIDSAVASSLAALLRSTKRKSNASRESVNDTNISPSDNITCHTSASEDGIYNHTEELITNTRTDTMQKKKSISIDSAVASSLTALLRSAKRKSNASHESVNDTNIGPLDNITCHNSASEDGIYDHPEELVTNTTSEICNKSESLTQCPKIDYLFSVANVDMPSSALTSEEGSDIIVMLPKAPTLCEFSDKEDDVLENKKEKDNTAKTRPAGSDKLNMWNEYINISSLDLNQNSTLASDNKSQVTDVSLENELCDVKFTQDKNWVSGLPLEVLLTDVSDSKLLEAFTSGGDGNCIADEDHGSETGSDMYGSWVS